jgi:ribosomal protein S18 acetylase RimI-like enzyme
MSYPASPPAPAVTVRPARPEEYARVGEVTETAYRSAALLSDDSAYVHELRDAAARAACAELLVAVDATGRVLGTVTLVVDLASPLSEIAREREAEVRMLAVDPVAQGRGIGELLARACVERSVAAGCERIVLCSRPQMRAAHRVYERLGFIRAPERDWEPSPGFVLMAYTLPLTGSAYCGRCGRPLADGDHATCATLGTLEPPRYCATCGRRMVVQVTPRSWSARCVEHGTISGGASGTG